jgi:flavin reductase (DIM6/NTAB) family NADH-FMN oxidoreductase RutF
MTTVHEGVWHGVTVNAVTCLSLSPQLMLVCLRDGARMTTLVRRSRRFNLSFLAEHHQSVARRFAGPRPTGAAAFDGIAVGVDESGLPYLTDATVVVRCELWRIYPGGDHAIVCGDMLAISAGTSPPVVFHAGTFRSVGAEVPAHQTWPDTGSDHDHREEVPRMIERYETLEDGSDIRTLFSAH